MTGSKLDWNGIGKSHAAPLENYVSNMPYLTFVGQGYHRGYRYGNPYTEFTTQGPNGPYTDCVYDPLFAEIDEKVNTSIRLITHEQTPVLDYSDGGLKVAGWPVANYPVHSTDGIRQWLEFEPKDRYLKPLEKFYHATYHDSVPDELELIYPTAMEPLNLTPGGAHPTWVWDTVEKVFAKYALANRPKLYPKRPHVNVGTVGHIDFGNNSRIANFVQLARATTSDEKWRAATGLIVNHGYRLERRPDPNVGAIGDVVYPTLRVEPRGF